MCSWYFNKSFPYKELDYVVCVYEVLLVGSRSFWGPVGWGSGPLWIGRRSTIGLGSVKFLEVGQSFCLNKMLPVINYPYPLVSKHLLKHFLWKFKGFMIFAKFKKWRQANYSCLKFHVFWNTSNTSYNNVSVLLKKLKQQTVEYYSLQDWIFYLVFCQHCLTHNTWFQHSISQYFGLHI